MNAAGHVDKVLLAASKSIGCAGDLPLQLPLQCTYCALCEMRYEGTSPTMQRLRQQTLIATTAAAMQLVKL
jgi:hypothetical protein